MRVTLGIGLACLAGCARIEPPPGGPPDNTPPALVSARPDSMAVMPGFDGPVEFTFSEVVSEGSQPSMGLGTSDLERLILLSPTDNVPRVRWRRSVIAVEPKEGWRPNTVYRVELLPGVADLQRNRLDSGTVVTFTTGAPLPTVSLSGTVVDWQGGRLARAALIDAVLLPDSLHYRTLTDSSGGYDFGPLPRGEYLVYAVIDQNRNLRRDIRDHFDTTRVRTDSSTTLAELWTAPRDTVGPRVQSVSVIDTMAIDLTFNQPLDPYQPFDPNLVSVRRLPDSALVQARSVLPRAMDDSVQRVARDTTRPDSAAAANDSARRAAEARAKPATGDPGREILATRPPLSDHLIVRLAAPLEPGTQYVVITSGVRNVNRVPGDSRLPFAVPERPPPPAATPDSTAPPRDSAAPVPPPGP